MYPGDIPIFVVGDTLKSKATLQIELCCLGPLDQSSGDGPISVVMESRLQWPYTLVWLRVWIDYRRSMVYILFYSLKLHRRTILCLANCSTKYACATAHVASRHHEVFTCLRSLGNV